MCFLAARDFMAGASGIRTGSLGPEAPGPGAMGKHDDHWLFSVEEKFRFPEGTHLFLCYCQWDFQLLI